MTLRERLAAPRIVLAPGVYDAGRIELARSVEDRSAVSCRFANDRRRLRIGRYRVTGKGTCYAAQAGRRLRRLLNAARGL